MSLARISVLILSLMLTVGVSSQVFHADNASRSEISILIVDRQAIGSTPGGVDMVSSLVGVLSVLNDQTPLTYLISDDPGRIVGPVSPSKAKFRTFLTQLDRDLNFPPSTSNWLFADALASAYNKLLDENALEGSKVYLITGGYSQPELIEQAENPSPIVGLFGDRGWPIISLNLPGTANQIVSDLGKLSAITGGTSIGLSIPDGLLSLFDQLPSSLSRNSLEMIELGNNNGDRVHTSSLSIAPGTEEATILFFKESVYGTLRLDNPDGIEEVPSMLSPHAVMWKLKDPLPGRWNIDIRGMGGNVFGWQGASNKYSIDLYQPRPFALGRTNSLMVSVKDSGKRVTIENAKVSAEVILSGSTGVVYLLNDEGLEGDAVAGDGFFSATMPALDTAGQYETRLKLYWPEHDHGILSHSKITAQAFPTIELANVEIEELQLDETRVIATIAIQVDGQPYPIATDEITGSVTSNTESSGYLELKPQELVSSGRAWLYKAYFTPDSGGLHTVIFHLMTQYAGSQHSSSSDSFVIKTAAAMSSVDTTKIVAEDPIPAVPDIDIVVEQPVLLELSDNAGFPWMLVIIPSVAVIVIVAFLLWRSTLSRPYGFLYNDQNELIVDFSGLERRPLMELLFKNSILGRELKINGLEGISFKFSRDKIAIRNQGKNSSVRLNSQPLLGQATVNERAWIGTGGKLYSLFRLPKPMMVDLSPANE